MPQSLAPMQALLLHEQNRQSEAGASSRPPPWSSRPVTVGIGAGHSSWRLTIQSLGPELHTHPAATLSGHDQADYKKFREEALSMKQEDLLIDIYCRLRVLENTLKGHPSEDLQNRAIYKKVEGVYMEHWNATDRRRMAEDFRPIFIRHTREGIRVNGEIDDKMLEPSYADEMHRKSQDSWGNYFFDIMHNENTDALSMAIYVTIVICIVISVISTIFSTIEVLAPYQLEWDIIESVVTILFTLEYLVRLIVVRNKMLYVTRLMNVFDLLAITPWYYKLIVGGNSSLGGVMRALRLSRIAKIRQIANPYTNILMESLSATISGTGSSLGIFLFICSVVTGTVVYEVEKHENSDFYNIPISMWFSIVTLTTVGYGDMNPTTTMGYIFGTITILVGVMLSSLIIMVVGQYYIDLLNEYQDEVKRIKQDLYDYFGPKRYRGAVMNKSVDHLYAAVKLNMTRRTEELEDDSTDDEGDYEPVSPKGAKRMNTSIAGVEGTTVGEQFASRVPQRRKTSLNLGFTDTLSVHTDITVE